MGAPKVLVITGDHFCEDPEKPGGAYGPEDLRLHRRMVEAMGSLDHWDVEIANRHAGLLERLRTAPPDLVVNFCDTGYMNRVELELHLPAYCELLGIPYTGATPAAIATCYDKAIVRAAAQALGIPVPGELGLCAGTLVAPRDTAYPVLIKPNKSDGSFGITQHALVRDASDARSYLAWLAREVPGRDLLVQEYLPGPEYGVALIGNPETGLEALTPLEVDFSGLGSGLSPILAYESKVDPSSPYYTRIEYRAARLSGDERDRVIADAKRLFSRLGLQDYARFDLRRGGDGEIKLIEVNPNPAWDPEAKLALMAGFSGLEYPMLLRRIIETAWERSRRRAARARA